MDSICCTVISHLGSSVVAMSGGWQAWSDPLGDGEGTWGSWGGASSAVGDEAAVAAAGWQGGWREEPWEQGGCREESWEQGSWREEPWKQGGWREEQVEWWHDESGWTEDRGSRAAAAVAAAPGEAAAAAAAAPADRVVYDLAYFRGWRFFHGSYRQHNAALKYFRDEREDPTDPFESAPVLFSNSEPAAVAAVIWGKGQGWSFNRDKMGEWKWQELIAQLDAESMRCAVQGHNGRSCGLVACACAPRPGSYDHKRHAKLKQDGMPQKDVRLPVWDFVFERDDGTSLRLHPQRATPVIETFEQEWWDKAVEPPPKGLGESWGKGTYKYYKNVQTKASLRFDAQKGAHLPPHKNQP